MVQGPGHQNLPEKTKVMGGKGMKERQLPCQVKVRKGEFEN